MRHAPLLFIAALSSITACNADAAPAEATPVAAPAAAPAVAPAVEEAPAAKVEATDEVELAPVASDPSFELRIDPAGKYVSGQLARIDLALTPRGEYHINQDYPISIELSGDDGIALPKAKFARADAAHFDEKKALFEVPLTPQAQGEHRIQAKVRFAVCTPETCVPDERTLALALNVE